jgi:hypothetical protein
MRTKQLSIQSLVEYRLIILALLQRNLSPVYAAFVTTLTRCITISALQRISYMDYISCSQDSKACKHFENFIAEGNVAKRSLNEACEEPQLYHSAFTRILQSFM